MNQVNTINQKINSVLAEQLTTEDVTLGYLAGFDLGLTNNNMRGL